MPFISYFSKRSLFRWFNISNKLILLQIQNTNSNHKSELNEDLVYLLSDKKKKKKKRLAKTVLFIIYHFVSGIMCDWFASILPAKFAKTDEILFKQKYDEPCVLCNSIVN